MMCPHEEGQFTHHEYQGGLLFDKKPFLILSDASRGEPFRVIESAGYGNRMWEDQRVLLKRYASRTPGTKRAILQ